MSNQLIIYRNKTEQNMDEFWYDIAIPFLGQHWWWILPMLLLACIGIWLYNNRRK